MGTPYPVEEDRELVGQRVVIPTLGHLYVREVKDVLIDLDPLLGIYYPIFLLNKPGPNGFFYARNEFYTLSDLETMLHDTVTS